MKYLVLLLALAGCATVEDSKPCVFTSTGSTMSINEHDMQCAMKEKPFTQAMRSCYRASPISADIDVKFTFEISQEGRAHDVNVETDQKDVNFKGCLRESFGQLVFPTHTSSMPIRARYQMFFTYRHNSVL